MWQAIVVGVLVVLAIVYAAWQLMPQSWRRKLLTVLLEHLQKPWQAPLARRLQAASSAKGGCGSCGGGGCSPAAGKPVVKGYTVASGGASGVADADNTRPLVFHPKRRKA